MTERKCEWLDGNEFSDILASYSIFSSADSVEEFDLICHFIRTRVEEEIRKEREACGNIVHEALEHLHGGGNARRLFSIVEDKIRARGGEK